MGKWKDNKIVITANNNNKVGIVNCLCRPDHFVLEEYNSNKNINRIVGF